MVMNSTKAVATIIHAVSPESSVAGSSAGAASSAAAGAASAGASWAMRVSTGNNVAANTNSALASTPKRVFFFMLIKGLLRLNKRFVPSNKYSPALEHRPCQPQTATRRSLP